MLSEVKSAVRQIKGKTWGILGLMVGLNAASLLVVKTHKGRVPKRSIILSATQILSVVGAIIYTEIKKQELQ